MAQTTLKEQFRASPGEVAKEELNRLRARIAENTRDLSDEEREDLIDRWAADVNAGLAEHVRKSRATNDQPPS